MTQYHFLDDSGDPGLSGAAGSSSYFVLAMVQLAVRAPLPEITAARAALHLLPVFEFKYFKTTPVQKATFFRSVQTIPFRVRAVAITKLGIPKQLTELDGQDFTIEFITHLVTRATSKLTNDVLVIDGETPEFRRALRVKLSSEYRKIGRVRPFKKIISGNSDREDGIQLADMVAGAVREFTLGEERSYYRTFADKVLDLWQVPEQQK